MTNKIIRFPQAGTQQEDPAFERAMFFLDQEIQEMTAVIPQAVPTEARAVY